MVATVQFAVFRLDGRRYGVGLEQVDQVVRAVDPTPLPHTPPMVLGIIDLHGTLIPVISIRHRLGAEPRTIGVDDQLMIAHTSKRTIALVVDSVEEVITCPADAIIPTKRILPQWNEIQGVIQLEDGLILIQDLERFLTLEENVSLDQALRGAMHDAE